MIAFEKKLQRILMTRLFWLQERTIVVNKMRLWKMSEAEKIEELVEIE